MAVQFTIISNCLLVTRNCARHPTTSCTLQLLSSRQTCRTMKCSDSTEVIKKYLVGSFIRYRSSSRATLVWHLFLMRDGWCLVNTRIVWFLPYNSKKQPSSSQGIHPTRGQRVHLIALLQVLHHTRIVCILSTSPQHGRCNIRCNVPSGLCVTVASSLFHHLLRQENSVNVGKHTARSDRHLTQQLVQLLVIAHCQLDVARHDTGLLVVTSGVTR